MKKCLFVLKLVLFSVVTGYSQFKEEYIKGEWLFQEFMNSNSLSDDEVYAFINKKDSFKIYFDENMFDFRYLKEHFTGNWEYIAKKQSIRLLKKNQTDYVYLKIIGLSPKYLILNYRKASFVLQRKNNEFNIKSD